MYVLLTLAVTVFISLRNKGLYPPSEMISFFLMGLIQLEVFIFAARIIFRKLETNIPRRSFTKIVLSRFFIFISICFCAAFILILFFNYTTTLISRGDVSAVFQDFIKYEFNRWFKSTLGGLSIGAIIFIVIQWQDALQREKKLIEENLVFQNETLRNQVNPHFLFNSLNTLSSLINSNPAAAEMFTGKLASIYRYILENCRKDKVPLSEELDYIIDYADLHKVRDEEKINLQVNVPDADKYKILPVSLQILIENAIKHNKATRENPLVIDVYAEGDYIVVRNNLQRMATRLGSTGIGLKNLAERMELTTGKSIIIDEDDNFYTVKLPLI
jgi:sensor histidine kinase YesM